MFEQHPNSYRQIAGCMVVVREFLFDVAWSLQRVLLVLLNKRFDCIKLFNLLLELIQFNVNYVSNVAALCAILCLTCYNCLCDVVQSTFNKSLSPPLTSRFAHL